MCTELPKSIGYWSLIGIMPPSLLGLLYLYPDYPEALMLFSISCEQSLRLNVSMNLLSYMPYEGLPLNFFFLEKSWCYKCIKQPEFSSRFLELDVCTWSFKCTKGFISTSIGKTVSHRENRGPLHVTLRYV